MRLYYTGKNKESHRLIGNQLWDFAEKDQDYEIKIEKRTVLRTVSQNKYYRILLYYVATHIGDWTDAAHEEMKRMFNPKVIYVPVTGEEKTIGGSTARLTKEEFTNYIDAIKNWLLIEHNCNTPDPQDDNFGDEYEKIKKEYERMISA